MLAALGCGDGSESGDSGWLELGTGTEQFEPIAAGAPLPLVAGNQGGHHVWLSFRASGLTSKDVRMLLEVVPRPPLMASHWDLPISLTEAESEEPTHEFLAWPAQILEPACAVNSAVQVRLTLEEPSGRRLSASVEITPQAPSDGSLPRCELP